MRSDLSSPLTRENRLAIFGAGGSGREVAWLAQQCWGEEVKLAFVIDEETPPEGILNGIPILQLREFAERYPGTPTVIAIGDSVLRERCVQKCVAAGPTLPSLEHPRVALSRLGRLCDGPVT